MRTIDIEGCSVCYIFFLCKQVFKKQEFLRCPFHRTYYTYKKQTHSPCSERYYVWDNIERFFRKSWNCSSENAIARQIVWVCEFLTRYRNHISERSFLVFLESFTCLREHNIAQNTVCSNMLFISDFLWNGHLRNSKFLAYACIRKRCATHILFLT